MELHGHARRKMCQTFANNEMNTKIERIHVLRMYRLITRDTITSTYF